MADPDQIHPSCSSGLSAIGSSFQWTKSVLTA
jgi:hypothetical protein